MFNRRSVFLFTLAAILIAHVAPGGVLQVGEELQYKVRYGFIRLGTVVVRTTRDTTRAGREYHVVIIAQSNPAIPFVNIREHVETIVDEATSMSRSFYGRYEGKGEHEIVRSQYDEHSRRILYLCSDPATGAITRNDTLRDAPAYVDGPSLLTFAREHSNCNSVLRVPTFVSGTMSWTTLDFTPPRTTVDIDAVTLPIRVRRYNGHADWTHVSDGTTGEFTGWVSDDDAAVPILARMKIVVGSITLELEKWTRSNWTPPVVQLSHAE